MVNKRKRTPTKEKQSAPMPVFPKPPEPPYHVLPETAIPLQAASKLVGWVATGVAERLELVIRTECDSIKALLRKHIRSKR